MFSRVNMCLHGYGSKRHRADGPGESAEQLCAGLSRGKLALDNCMRHFQGLARRGTCMPSLFGAALASLIP